MRLFFLLNGKNPPPWPQGLLPLLQPRHPRGLDGSEVLEGGGYVRLSPGAALQ